MTHQRKCLVISLELQCKLGERTMCRHWHCWEAARETRHLSSWQARRAKERQERTISSLGKGSSESMDTKIAKVMSAASAS